MLIQSGATIAEFVTLTRRSRLITQKQLARDSRVSPRTIYAIEHGDESVSFATILRVLRILNFDLEIVYDGGPSGGRGKIAKIRSSNKVRTIRKPPRARKPKEPPAWMSLAAEFDAKKNKSNGPWPESKST